MCLWVLLLVRCAFCGGSRPRRARRGRADGRQPVRRHVRLFRRGQSVHSARGGVSGAPGAVWRSYEFSAVANGRSLFGGGGRLSYSSILKTLPHRRRNTELVAFVSLLPRPRPRRRATCSRDASVAFPRVCSISASASCAVVGAFRSKHGHALERVPLLRAAQQRYARVSTARAPSKTFVAK